MKTLAIMLAAGLAAAAHAGPLIVGMDHIPIVVSNLEQAKADYRAMGFAVKPGRAHVNGIRNAHVKFADGTELELITAPEARDALTSEYRAKLRSGEGPVYFGLYASDRPALEARLKALGTGVEEEGDLLTFPKKDPLHPLFFASRQKAPNDKPEYFAHINTAVRLAGLWVRERAEYRTLFGKLGIPIRAMAACGPVESGIEIARLPEGDLHLVDAWPGIANVIGARVEVKNLAAVRDRLRNNGFAAKAFPPCDRPSLWLPPGSAHGIWLEFVQIPSH